MKKFIFCLLFFAFLLVACNESQLTISEIQNVPTDVQERIHTDYTLQLINDSSKGDAYIVFQSQGIVTAELEVKENKLDIKLNSANQEDQTVKQYVYKITPGDAEYDTINVLVNGKATHFDNVSGF